MTDNEERLIELKDRVCRSIDETREKLHRLSQDIWSCPELAYQETEAHDRLVAFFTHEHGWTVDSHFKLETAFRATWRTGGDSEGTMNVGFLCEYDALPGIGHACGHNLIAEVGAAAAVGLKAALEGAQEGVPVQVTVLGTPAEEDVGGKIDLLKEGAFKGIDVVFMAHPSKEDATYLPCVAEHDVTIKYHGKTTHASSYPWRGVNALDAAVLCYNNLSVLRQQMRPDWRVHGIIKHGGLKPNIIPDYTELEYYLRTPTRAELPVLKEKAERCFRSAAVATGCTVEVEYARNQLDNILRVAELERLFERNGKTLGMDFTTDEDVLRNESGSTDFGNVTFAVPGIHPYFYIGSNALNHTPEYTVAAGDEKAQFFTLRTAKALAMTALDLLLQPEAMQRVMQEFTEVKLKDDKMSNGV
ncbi:peptidase M20 domain-containing protein 2-like [Takifugu rubripes]|uniref:Peptidase M20 domain-containing protein 2 n=1 Tax=Takifugu rubripes TaxID=31033 RepID=H2S7S1_TAKRU|nr:peptidase M20 domain-containing protein 2-like [Takifugu rubripes]